MYIKTLSVRKGDLRITDCVHTRPRIISLVWVSRNANFSGFPCRKSIDRRIKHYHALTITILLSLLFFVRDVCGEQQRFYILNRVKRHFCQSSTARRVLFGRFLYYFFPKTEFSQPQYSLRLPPPPPPLLSVRSIKQTAWVKLWRFLFTVNITVRR